MKRTVITLSFSLFSIFVLAQGFEWATSGGYVGIANSYYGARDMAVNSQGHSYVYDFALGDQQCQGDTAYSLGTYHPFIYHFDASGALQQIIVMGGYNYPINIEVDDEDNLYLLIYALDNHVSLGAVDVDLPAASSNYVIKMTPDGEFVWLKDADFSDAESNMLLVHDDHLYFQDGLLSIAKCDLDGNEVASFSADSFTPHASDFGVHFSGATYLNNGDLVFAALSRGDLIIEEDTLINSIQYNNAPSILLLRCNQDLEYGWSSYIKSVRTPDEEFIPLASDHENYIYCGIQVSDSTFVGQDTIINQFSNYVGGLAIYDVQGNGLYGVTIPESSGGMAWACIEDPNGNGVWISGNYIYPTTWGPVTLDPLDGKAFLALINNEGQIVEGIAYSELTGTRAMCMGKSADDQLLIGGYTSWFEEATFTCLPVAESKGFYVSKYNFSIPPPPTPSITQTGNTLMASPDYVGEIQWYFESNPIDGATAQTYEATQDGNYSVIYTNPIGCVTSAGSELFNATIISVKENDHLVKVYPNPSSGNVNIDSDVNTDLKVFDPEGRLIRTMNIPGGKTQLAMHDLEAGVYIFRFKDRQMRVIIQ